MKKTKIIMGMPITVCIQNETNSLLFKKVFDYFKHIDKLFSTYKEDSLISKINRGFNPLYCSKEIQEILILSEKTKQETFGYFDVFKDGYLDPSGIVKGYAIWKAAQMLKEKGVINFYIEAGGDIQAHGDYKLQEQEGWQVGIRNPFNINQVVKRLNIKNKGVATSGRYIRGDHIYNPKTNRKADQILSLTVIGPNIYEADRFATAAFAMGRSGINFIQSLSGFDGYMIDNRGIATMTTNFEMYQDD